MHVNFVNIHTHPLPKALTFKVLVKTVQGFITFNEIYNRATYRFLDDTFLQQIIFQLKVV